MTACCVCENVRACVGTVGAGAMGLAGKDLILRPSYGELE